MDDHRLRVAIIIGDLRTRGAGREAAECLAALARRRDHLDVDVIDLAEAWLPERLPDGAPVPATVRDLSLWLAPADAFIVVIAEDDHGFPTPFKNAIDWCSQEWGAKPVAFVSYGDHGVHGGVYAVEHLRQVLAGLHAVTVPDTVSLGRHITPGDADPLVTTMLDRLVWWGRTLRRARAENSYRVINERKG